MRRMHWLWSITITNINHSLVRIKTAAVEVIEGNMTKEIQGIIS